MKNGLMFLGLLVFGFACGDVADDDTLDPSDETFLVAGGADSIFGVDEGSPLALGILDLVNHATYEKLDDDVRLNSRAVDYIFERRGEVGMIESLEELDAVKYVGRSAFTRLASYAEENGYVQNPTGELVEALQHSIEELDEAIDGLERNIDRLEDELYANQSEIRVLIGNIENRRDQIEENYEDNRTWGIIGILAGCSACGAVSLANMFEDDDRLNALEGELDRARERERAVTREISEYESAKRQIQRELSALREAEEVYRDFESRQNVDSELLEAAGERAAVLFQRVSNLRALELNLGNQVGVLQAHESLLRRTGTEVSRTLDLVRASAELADELAEASDAALVRAIEIMLSADPSASAQQYLEQRMKSMLKDVLGFVPTPAGIRAKLIKDVVRAIAKRHFDDLESEEAQTFMRELREALS